MSGIPFIRDVSIDDYICEIKKSLKYGNYFSALVLSLIIPDICSKLDSVKTGYVDWYNKYVYKQYYGVLYNDKIIKSDKSYLPRDINVDGDVCYALRNAILHSGTNRLVFTSDDKREKARIDFIDLCINSDSDIFHQYGEAVSIITCTTSGSVKKEITIRINMIILIDAIIKGYEEFRHQMEKTVLFPIFDWDKKGDE